MASACCVDDDVADLADLADLTRPLDPLVDAALVVLADLAGALVDALDLLAFVDFALPEVDVLEDVADLFVDLVDGERVAMREPSPDAPRRNPAPMHHFDGRQLPRLIRATRHDVGARAGRRSPRRFFTDQTGPAAGLFDKARDAMGGD
jgi:hypothetical protein